MDPAVHVEYTINLGTIIGIAVNIIMFVVGGAMVWSAFKSRVDTVLNAQDRLMTHLTDRFESHEKRDEEMFSQVQLRLADLAGGLQRLIGRAEVEDRTPWPKNERRKV